MGIERLLRPLGPVSPLPPALVGMFGTFGLLLLVRKVLGAKWADRAFHFLEPGYRTLVKWGTCFFIPALAALPVAVADNIAVFSSVAVVVKLLILIVLGYMGSLLATGTLAGVFEKAFSSSHFYLSDAVTEAATAANQNSGGTGLNERVLLAKLRGSPSNFPEVVKELPQDIVDFVMGDRFREGCSQRFAELDISETGSLTAEELEPVIVNLTQAARISRLSANNLDLLAAECASAFGSADNNRIAKNDFVNFSRFVVVDSYLRSRLSQVANPAKDVEGNKSKKKVRPYSLNWLKVYGACMGASLVMFFLGAANPAGAAAALKPAVEAIFVLCAVLGGFVIGQNLPDPWPQRVNPMITSIVLTYLACALWGFCSSSSFMTVLSNFKGAQGAGGLILMPLLQPLLISLGLSLYERRKVLRDDLAVILCTTCGSAAFGLFFTAVLAGPILNLPLVLAASAVPRCVTAALALAIASMLAPMANAAFSIALVQVMGLMGAAQGLNIMKSLGFTSPLQRGLSMGATAAGLGTVAIAKTDPEAFGYSAVSFALCGAFATSLMAVVPLRKLLIKILLFGR